MSRQGRAAGAFDLPADPAAFAAECWRRGWTDGLPVIPPTAERVAAMLKATRRDPLEVVATLPPRQGEATVEAIAVNAVMAGCEPKHLGILLAAVEGVSHERFNLDGINATTHPAGVFILVSGPAARAAGIHGGAGCFGPGFPANATIGRALRLILLSIAGATPGKGDRATQGTPAKLAFCATEREDASPWPPFHTTRGLEAGQSCVTVFACEGPHNIQDHGSNTPEGILQTVAGAMGQAGSNNILARGEPILVFGPEHVATVATGGHTRESVQRYLFEHARYPASKLSPEFLDMVRDRLQGGDPNEPLDALLPMADGPESIHILVAGGPGKHSCWMPTFGGMTRPVTVGLG
ncbi:MAG: hypothetical protein ACKVVT_06555 [Dehalococcoidia bacterium]